MEFLQGDGREACVTSAAVGGGAPDPSKRSKGWNPAVGSQEPCNDRFEYVLGFGFQISDF